MKKELQIRFRKLCDQLLRERNKSGYWEGMLSSSALSTAVAIVALKKDGNITDPEKIIAGLKWLRANCNKDGGFGDTPRGLSNVSTSLLVYAAVFYCRTAKEDDDLLINMQTYLSSQKISLYNDDVVPSVLSYYGRDYTFSVPILSMLSICSVIPKQSVSGIPQLPFELALLPASWYRFMNLHVVSYALPALIGVGIYTHTKSCNSAINLKGFYRNRFIKPAVRKLEHIMPESGGFLEATPLTGFVSMCLIESGMAENVVVRKGLDFLRSQQRMDGSWPIDTDLSSWVTSLSVKSLGALTKSILGDESVHILRKYILGLQYKHTHSFNGAEPGGWGWTRYSGSVPDSDDTSGAILALLEIYSGTAEETTAVLNGCKWLLSVQNKDGGFPTFCKGWGKLPFDKSCADITGHALLAFMKTREKLYPHIPSDFQKRLGKSIFSALDFLTTHQSLEGAWLPLWFGNQETPGKTNPVYGTSRVCIYLQDCLMLHRQNKKHIEITGKMVFKARKYLLKQQNADGSWGGRLNIKGTIEETSLAVSALAPVYKRECEKALEWLSQHENLPPAPIGLYFAMLWYDEKMYPLVFQTEALRRFLESG